MEAIKKELEKYNNDIAFTMYNQYPYAVSYLMSYINVNNDYVSVFEKSPVNWDGEIWVKMCSITYHDRVLLCSKLLKYENDRLFRIKEGDSLTHEKLLNLGFKEGVNFFYEKDGIGLNVSKMVDPFTINFKHSNDSYSIIKKVSDLKKLYLILTGKEL